MAFLDTVTIFTGQQLMLADDYRKGLDLPNQSRLEKITWAVTLRVCTWDSTKSRARVNRAQAASPYGLVSQI
ncbi:MAG: hypothetical protein O6949_09340 [Chloroflexi bacterium]|nr:hypothetical protein [Chloroflexota bacterium]